MLRALQQGSDPFPATRVAELDLSWLSDGGHHTHLLNMEAVVKHTSRVVAYVADMTLPAGRPSGTGCPLLKGKLEWVDRWMPGL